MVLPDAVQELIDLLDLQWDDSRTDGLRPTFRKAWDNKRSSQLLARPRQDLVVVSETSRPIMLAGNGGVDNDAFSDTSRLTVDVRVVGDEAHALRVWNEVFRVLSVNMSTGTSGFPKIIPKFSDNRNLSDKAINLFRYTVPVELRTHRRDFSE